MRKAGAPARSWDSGPAYTNTNRRLRVSFLGFAGAKPYLGVPNNLNEAFLVDTPTRERLVREAPRSAEIIESYPRGQDIKRWSPEWRGLWIIVLKSSIDHTWPWSNFSDAAEDVFRRTYPSLHAHMKPLEGKMRSRYDKGVYWWELRSCAYYDVFEKPKYVIQRIAFHPRVGLDFGNRYLNDSAIMLPTEDAWLLACLNSPANWYFSFRYFPHKKDEALSMDSAYVEKLPIAPSTDEVRAEAEEAGERLVGITRSDQEARRDLLDWLRMEFGIEKPGQKLENFAALDADAFVEEVRKRRPRSEGRLAPAALKDLRAGTRRWRRQHARIGSRPRH